MDLTGAVILLVDKTSTNSNGSYLRTLKTLTDTTLRLSDDIGIMADRIGVMADRIVYTEELISRQSKMINDSTLHVINKFKFQTPSTIVSAIPHL